ncbi:hypothetical protein [Nonomuraea dietziae]|uniref:ABM domain-containing protein n=1 Tax=Nonomuraea dietziae TaxID=65515 RepID=A0A7W5VKC4_9ACTN|nr:hypothetical protein [Nonomuraea dietziae]MBB3733920.1 hypothetical protein [Nonomuraea dietziae]
MSKTVVVRCATRAEAAEENQRLVEQVFAELAGQTPEGLRYAVFRLADGVTFVHVVDDEGDIPPTLAPFKEFQKQIADRVATTRIARQP